MSNAPNPANPPPAVTTVPLAKITAPVDIPQQQKPRSYLEGIGSAMMVVVLCVICIVVIAFLISWWCTQPTLEQAKQLIAAAHGNDTSKGIDPQILVDLHAKLQHEHTNAYRDFFQMLVLSGLVPLFTLLAGYVFGKQAGQKEGSSSSGGE